MPVLELFPAWEGVGEMNKESPKRRNNPLLHRLANRRYRKNHLKEVRARDRAFHAAHREHRNAQRRAWDVANPERRKQQQRHGYIRNRPERIRRSIAWASANRESHLRSQRKNKNHGVRSLSDRYLREICGGFPTPTMMQTAKTRLLAKRTRRVLRLMNVAALLGRIQLDSNQTLL
jgi:hypothetical protein